MNPSFLDFLYFIGVDFLAFILIKILYNRVFLKVYPECKVFFDGLTREDILKLSATEKHQLFRSLIRFPQIQARSVFIVNFLKTIPAGIIAIYVWQHNTSNFVQFIIFYSIASSFGVYTYASVFLENHNFISEMFAEYHDLFDWQTLLEKEKDVYKNENFTFQETITLIFVWLFTLSCQWVIIVEPESPNDFMSKTFRFILSGVIGLALMSRIWYLARTYFFKGLDRIFSEFSKLQPNAKPVTLSLHTSGLLAMFEGTYNSLAKKLNDYEQELSHWVVSHAEKNRFQVTGEIAGLVMHDLSAPLNVIKFCTDEVEQDPAAFQKKPKYLEYLISNTDNAIGLIESLRSFLRNEKLGEQSQITNFNEVMNVCLRLLQTQFASQGFNDVIFQFSDELKKTNIAMSRPDLIHVFMNIYSNSVRNMLSNHISPAKIESTITELENNFVEIRVRDYGTGLSVKDFEQMTSVSIIKESADEVTSKEIKGSLGMRLIRRLMERYDFKLYVEVPKEGSGTVFVLRVKVT